MEIIPTSYISFILMIFASNFLYAFIGKRETSFRLSHLLHCFAFVRHRWAARVFKKNWNYSRIFSSYYLTILLSCFSQTMSGGFRITFFGFFARLSCLSLAVLQERVALWCTVMYCEVLLSTCDVPWYTVTGNLCSKATGSGEMMVGVTRRTSLQKKFS